MKRFFPEAWFDFICGVLALSIVFTICLIVLGAVFHGIHKKPQTEEQKARESFISACSHRNYGIPDTQSNPWKCIKK